MLSEVKPELNLSYKKIMFTIFSHLDEKTLRQTVPLVNKDWLGWQQLYLQEREQNEKDNFYIETLHHLR